jgi:putative transposase
MDFVHDASADGRAFRVLTVVDLWSRQSPLLKMATAMSGRHVADALVLATSPTPRSITAPNFRRALEDWAYQRGV